MFRRTSVLGAVAIAAAVGLGGCRKPEAADAPSAAAAPGKAQGWSDAERAAWYNAGQGSRLMPLAWFLALEQPAGGTGGRFADPGYLATFGILPPAGQAKLPIGFAANTIADDTGFRKTSLHWTGTDPARDPVPWVGLTCAACHTARIVHDGQALTVDGAPAMFDFQSFIEALDTSLAETRDDPGRWDRFAKAVLAAADGPEARTRLRGELDKLIAWEAAAAALNGPDPNDPETASRYGYGRVDAVGHIYNRVLLFGGAPQPRRNPADAPVSYPHLWNITKQTRLQWNGIAQTAKLDVGATPTDFGALGRNTGEVIGVFGEVVIRKRSGPADLSGFASTVDMENLNALEVQLTRLQPPKWPAAFGAPGEIDLNDAQGRKLSPREVLDAGSRLFGAQCASCHTPQQTYETMKTFAEMGPDQTDEWMACNAWAYTGASGALAGIPLNYKDGDKLPANTQVAALLTTTVKGALIGKKLDVVKVAGQNIFGVTPLPKVRPTPSLAPETAKAQRLKLCQANATNPLLAYKARPLEGIWATAPYLHNGSVPTLYDLLLPVEKRPETFLTGTRVYDPQKAGFVTASGAAGNSFTFDVRRAGNSNKGHVYGVGRLTETERLQLLEYLKTL